MSAGTETPGPGGSIHTVAVLGAGTMGHGIAQVCAQAGCVTRLYDIDGAAVQAGIERIRGNLDKGVERGKVTDEQRRAAMERVEGATIVADAVSGVDLVVEAAPESMELKQRLLTEVEQSAPSHAVLATNTSSLSIDGIASSLEDAGRLVGMHFFNPVHIMALVEIVRGQSTSTETLEAAVDFARRLGKDPIVVKDAPGFASSRLGIALGMEAIRMVEQGVATAEDIDKAMELGYRHPMGPLKLTDLVGLDVRLKIAEYLHETLGTDAFEPPELLRRMVDEGRLGKKSGRGFYEWSDA